MLKSTCHTLVFLCMVVLSGCLMNSPVRDNFIRFKYENRAWCERTGLEDSDEDLDKVEFVLMSYSN